MTQGRSPSPPLATGPIRVALSRRHVLGLAAAFAATPAFAAEDRFALTGQATQGGWLRGRVPPGTVSLHLDDLPVAFAPDGAFLIAFDRDAPPRAVLVAGGSDARQELAIAPRAWPVEHVDAPMHPPGLPDAEFARRRAGELAQIKAARAQTSDSQGWRRTMVRPAQGPVSGRFGAQRVFRGVPAAYHAGMDIAAGAGTAIVAPADGVVVLAAVAELFTLEGHLLIIDHGMGLNSALLHARRLGVEPGAVVRQGQVVGEVGMTGRATGPHLHWSLTWHGRRLDPLLFLV